MTPDETLALTRSLMDQHGLFHWTAKLDGGKTRFGLCSYDRQTISVSRHLAAINPESEIRNTILHEIAHALVGPGHNHGPVWKAKAREIGAIPSATHIAKAAPPKYLGHCPTPGCDTVAKAYRRHRTPKACSKCCIAYANGKYDARFQIVWTAV